ncbi:MAG: glycine cleavage system aminomethyltransferase GcvT [Candidatus Eremiobacteraeota bacterium]|nr:glycine cleavage system aminomethyltransferase GcvT [Candidatus Eremiobacteraeota bacterium]MBV8223196.1 glycine cleavage system aminomethyltransferase GcvT [Candidatus Eremiobacteraeota bacterium]MBV8282779.1 glycine cleavage system aminomethyltransferase GcvT [Candidatus Eremiobacteraeota bacterium]
MARTPLSAVHEGLGAKMSPFGGFLMPIQYAGILDEHRAVRSAAGMFDLSHMGQFVATGEGVPEWLDRLTVNAVGTMKPGQARYNIFTNERGGAMDDAIIYRLDGRWLVVVNAANSEKMWRWLSSQVPAGVTLTDRTPQSALIAIQGPRSLELLQPLTDVGLANIKYYHATEGVVAGAHAEIARTGYTGEDGFELFVSADAAQELWQTLTREGARVGLRPAGLGARDVLRLEAGMPLYGHELEEDITPLQAGLDIFVKLEKPAFVGRDALVRQRTQNDFDRIVGLVMDGRAPARAGYAVWRGQERVGEIRSGSPAPALGGKNIATALVRADASAIGTTLDVEIRGQRHRGAVVPLPFYKRAR